MGAGEDADQKGTLVAEWQSLKCWGEGMGIQGAPVVVVGGHLGASGGGRRYGERCLQLPLPLWLL